MKIHWLLVLLVCSAFADAREINVADHGVVPGKDASYSLNRLLETLQGESNVTLVFPAGQYEFYPENAVEQHRAVSNHDNSLKRIAFPLFGFEDLTIDGRGSTFMFHGRISPLAIDGCQQVKLQNFSIDWSRSFHDELPVVQSNLQDQSFVVEIDPEKYPHTIQHGELFSEKYDWQDRMGSNIIFDPKTRAPIHDTKSYSVNFTRPYKATSVGKNRVKIEAAVRRPPPVGSVLISYGTHPTSRLCPAIHLSNSSDVSIRNVTIHDAGGMGVIAERTENVDLDGVTVTSTDDRLVSTRADATHFIGCKGTIRVENCLFEHMLDDAINVHGAYVKVEDYLGNNEFLCEISHFQQWGLIFAGEGDKVSLLSRETILPLFETTVKGVKVLNERRFVVTLNEVPDQLPEGLLSIENLSWYPDVVFKNNTVRENRARSALITTKGKVLIEGNYFSSQMNGILIEGDNNKWYESGGVEDITIKNNVFENSGFGAGEVYPLLASPLLTPQQSMGEGQYHRNINFVGNTLKSFDGRMVLARSVSGLNISGNKLEFGSDYPANADLPAIDLQYCDGVTIANNRAVGFGRRLEIKQAADCSPAKIERNQGFANDSQVAHKVGRARGQKPNIVLFFVDDQGWSDLGYRNDKFEAPHIDQLAAEGMDFTQATIACPTCSPLLTGKHPARLQLVRHIPHGKESGFDKFGRTNTKLNYWPTDPAKFPCVNWLDLEHQTYAEALQELGYYNLFVGKWHLGHEPYHPIHQGFDHQVGASNWGHPRSYYPPYFKNSDILADEKERYLTDKLTDEAVEFIEDYDGSKPFMLSFWYYSVHGPHVGRKDLVKHFEQRGLKGKEAHYAAMVKAVDESVGRVRKALTEKGIDKDTIVIYLSDQGGAFNNAPFHGGKKLDTLYEGGARVPLIVHWPSVTPAGSQNESIVQSTDLFPTLVDIAGGDAAKYQPLDGTSLLSTIKSGEPLDRGEPIYGYRAYEDLYASVRKDKWKLLAYRSGALKLYSLTDDIGEENDLAKQFPEKVQQLKASLAGWEREMGVEGYSGVQ